MNFLLNGESNPMHPPIVNSIATVGAAALLPQNIYGAEPHCNVLIAGA